MKGAIQFRPIKTKKYSAPEVLREVKKALDYEGRVERTMFESTTKTWRRKVKFVSVVVAGGGIAAVATGTDDKIYQYVNDGTRAHIIRPVRARVLRFRTGYRSKTSPRVIGSHKGGASGPYRFAMRVRHPGTKARRFDDEIQKRRKQPFAKLVQDAITKGLSKVS